MALYETCTNAGLMPLCTNQEYEATMFMHEGQMVAACRKPLWTEYWTTRSLWGGTIAAKAMGASEALRMFMIDSYVFDNGYRFVPAGGVQFVYGAGDSSPVTSNTLHTPPYALCLGDPHGLGRFFSVLFLEPKKKKKVHGHIGTIFSFSSSSRLAYSSVLFAASPFNPMVELDCQNWGCPSHVTKAWLKRDSPDDDGIFLLETNGDPNTCNRKNAPLASNDALACTYARDYWMPSSIWLVRGCWRYQLWV